MTRWQAFAGLAACLAVSFTAEVGAGDFSSVVSSRAVSSGKHFTVMETVRQKTNQSGTSLVTNRFTILGNGLNRLDEGSNYVECTPVVLSYPSGIFCTGATYSVIIGNDLKSGVVDLETGEKQRIVSRPLGIAFYDRDSGKRAWLATVKSCPAEVISNRVVFRDAFDGIAASVVFEYRAGRFSQSVIFSKSLAVTPADFGMTSGRLELITEIVQSPTPTVTEHVLASETNSTKRATMAEPDVIDETLRFGGDEGMFMPLGRAFATGSMQAQRGIVVAKRLIETEDQRVALVESMDWNEAKGELEKLPLSTVSVNASNLVVSFKRQLPKHAVQDSPPSFAAHLAQVVSNAHSTAGPCIRAARQRLL